MKCIHYPNYLAFIYIWEKKCKDLPEVWLSMELIVSVKMNFYISVELVLEVWRVFNEKPFQSASKSESADILSHISADSDPAKQNRYIVTHVDIHSQKCNEICCLNEEAVVMAANISVATFLEEDEGFCYFFLRGWRFLWSLRLLKMKILANLRRNYDEVHVRVSRQLNGSKSQRELTWVLDIFTVSDWNQSSF